MKPLAEVAVIVIAVPAGLALAWRVAGLNKVLAAGRALGKKAIGDRIQGGAQNLSGRLANWGANRGIVGRTVARIGTGNVLPGGRSRMEREGESYRKAASERKAARGSYRATPSSRMNAEALERTSVEAIQRWVNDPKMAGDVGALRQMVLDTPSIKLSTAQRKALFQGMGENPATGDPLMPGPAGSGPIPGAPTPLTGNASSGNVDRPAGGQTAFGRWWSERPTVLPGVRQDSQPRGPLGLGYVAAHYLGSGSRQWRGWLGRAAGVSGTAPPAPNAPNPPRGPNDPFAP